MNRPGFSLGDRLLLALAVLLITGAAWGIGTLLASWFSPREEMPSRPHPDSDYLKPTKNNAMRIRRAAWSTP